jgi:hypothetical protein
MPVGDRDRRHMSRLARDLADLEQHGEPDAAVLRRAVTRANRDRRARGLPELAEDEELPGSELYRRARALGLGRRRR